MTSWVHVSLDLARDDADRGAELWSRALDWPLGDPWPSNPEFRTFVPPSGDPYVILQLIDGPSRIHLDLEVAEMDAAADRLVRLGASPVRRTDQWLTPASPGGLPFCLVDSSPHGRRPVVRGAQGQRTRLVQVCIDSPMAVHDQEVAFWRAATGWRWRASENDDGGFAGKLFPEPGSPIQLLLQRLGEEDPATAVRAHLDLGCDDLDAEARRLVGLGASRLWDGPGWITLRDPARLLFCVTGNSPDAP
jgi:hypothetical protein